jgi:hypothetical protein
MVRSRPPFRACSVNVCLMVQDMVITVVGGFSSRLSLLIFFVGREMPGGLSLSILYLGNIAAGAAIGVAGFAFGIGMVAFAEAQVR